MTHAHSDKSGDQAGLEALARDILTREKPTLYLGSSQRWGWNDQDPVRNRLLSRLRKSVPGMDQAHIPDWKALDSMSFSPGISILAGIPQSRLEMVLEHLDAERSQEGLVVVLDEQDRPLKAHHRVDVRNHERLEALILQIEKTISEKHVSPWGHSAEGRAHQEHLEKVNNQQRPDWKWDETRSLNVPEEFRHELAAGLDEHAE